MNRSATLQSIDPATGQQLATWSVLDDAALERSLALASRAADHWSGLAVEQRCAALSRLADVLESQREPLARLITQEMGKLHAEALAEIDKCAWVCRYYAEQAPQMLADQVVATEARRSLVACQPLGAVLAVMPWNFPFWQVFRAAAPILAAGNVLLLKHASNVTGCGEAIARLFAEAGFPEGVFVHLPIEARRVARVIADRQVVAVTLTGSEAAGRAVAAAAGQALKKCVLELGGSDPFVVLEDADLEQAAATAVTSRFMNCGQSCIAAKRFIVLDAVADAFTEAFVEKTRNLQPGPPADPGSTLAPMARADLRDELASQVQDAVSKGARRLLEGGPVEGEGWYYRPEVLTDVTPDMRAWHEELFGPVAVIYRVPDEAEALRLANATAFGLGGSVWTEDRERGEQLARRLACGCAFVNSLVRSDPRLPFGGIRDSGYGRELSLLGIREFVNQKTLWID